MSLCLAFFLRKKKCPLISRFKFLTQVLYAIPAWNKFSVIQLDSSSTRVTMCDPLDIRPKFKGVVISSTSLLAFLAIITLVGSTSVPNTNIGPYCIYLEQTQELRCNCQNLSFNRSQPTVFPNNEFFVPTTSEHGASKVKEVAALKLTGCEKLHLTLDLRPLPHPFYR